MNLIRYPKIFLVLDNCFAIKRWIKPLEWMELIKEIGFKYAQASTDNEIDPLFSPIDYMDEWFSDVRRCEKSTGVKVVNFYTGYQTYRTVGLAHHDVRVRRQLMDKWLKPLIWRIAELGASGIGFSFFAIPDEVLQDPNKYKERTEIILNLLGELSEYAFENGNIQVSFEQMYAPHQPPWTIKGTQEYLKNIFSINKKPIYVTLDVGHMVGQTKFMRASETEIENSLANACQSGSVPSIWLGSDSVYDKWYSAKKGYQNKKEIAEAVLAIKKEMDKYPYMFADKKDSDPFKWLEELACYSPIIHMQQTNGISSSHAAFTLETNKTGIITGERLLEAIAKSYKKAAQKEMPPVVDNIYLSFEIFASNVEKKREIITKLKQTLEYWRKYIPEDGISLDKLL